MGEESLVGVAGVSSAYDDDDVYFNKLQRKVLQNLFFT
jgi:hypothetical protein